MDTAKLDSQSWGVRSPDIRRMTILGQDVRVGIWPGETNVRPLLIFNGIGAALELLAPFVAKVDPRREVIMFDVPGAGQSPAPRLPYRLWMLAHFASRLLDQLGHQCVDVMGVSWGGALAQQFGFQQPRRCGKLILAATAPGMLMIPGPMRAMRLMANPRRFSDRTYLHANFGTLYGGAARTSSALFEEFAARLRPPNRRGYSFQQMAMLGWTSLPFLPLIRQPTLIIAGDDDPLVPSINARLMARLIPRSELKILEDGHLFLMSQPDVCATVVNAFLNDD